MVEALTNEPPVRVIERTHGLARIDLRELWRNRELVFFLTWRAVLVRYKQTLLGAAWAVLQPFFLMLVFLVLFARLVKAPHAGVPYPLFAYSSLCLWTFFSTSLSQTSSSMVGAGGLLTKVYFPRLAIPLSTVLSAFVDFCVSLTLLIGLMGWYGYHPRPIAIVALPGLLLLTACVALGAGLWLAVLNVLYRDVGYVVPFMIQLWLFSTPAIFQSRTFGEPWRTIFGLNPMQGIVSGWRSALLGTASAPGATVWVSVAVAAVLLVTGLLFFARMERNFADVV